MLLESRDNGFAFDEAWPAATEHALRRAQGSTRAAWRLVLDDTAASWQAAYELRPDPLARPIGAMRPEPAEHEPDHRRSAPRMPAIVPLHQRPKRKAA